jgi:hypothetical protein
MVASELWYNKFKKTMGKASKMGSGCVYCSTGRCLTSFGDWNAEGPLRKWHSEWFNISKDQQDIHLSWMIGTSSVDDDSSVGGTDRIPTSSDDGNSSGSDEECTPEPPSKKPRRQYSLGQPRRAAHTFEFLGHTVCKKAALYLMRVGENRLERVRDGRLDGRRDAPHAPGQMTTSVWRFLWTLYHTVGEGMPDKFSFETDDVNTLTLRACKSLTRKTPASQPIQDQDIDVDKVVHSNSHEHDDDQHVRAIAGHAMYVVSQENPVDSVLVGPGIFRGPQRFLPPK